MTKTEQKSLRLTAETVSQIEWLAKYWSPIGLPLSAADVVTECVRRTYEAQVKAKKKS